MKAKSERAQINKGKAGLLIESFFFFFCSLRKNQVIFKMKAQTKGMNTMDDQQPPSYL